MQTKTFPFIEVDFSVTIWDHPAQPIFFHYSPYLPLSCPVHSHPATPKKLRLFCMLTLLLYYSKIQIFFTARKRFVVPSDEEPLRPVPVRLFPRRNEAAVAICDEDSSAAPPLVPESTCDFCLRAPCITSSDFKPRGRCLRRYSDYLYSNIFEYFPELFESLRLEHEIHDAINGYEYSRCTSRNCVCLEYSRIILHHNHIFESRILYNILAFTQLEVQPMASRLNCVGGTWNCVNI